MIVYGDRTRQVSPQACLAVLLADYAAVGGMAPGIDRHGRLAGVFISAGELAQGLADFEMAGSGWDDCTALGAAAMDLLGQLARTLIGSWDSGFAGTLPPLASGLTGLPDQITLRTPEGYAFYALYPEAYALAARSLPVCPTRVIGLRSIGTGLAAVVAAAIGAPAPHTVRPIGHPFERTLSLSPALAAALSAPGRLLVVDEGPGLSGSSFGAVADFLQRAAADVVCLPSHGHDPGAAVSRAHLSRWPAIRGPVVTFDGLSLAADRPEHRLGAWFADVLGEIATLTDLSGGAWRAARGLDVPVVAAQERRKFLACSERGAFLLKFVGLGDIGRAKFARAQLLGEAGFIPQPLAFRHGFMAEPWYRDAKPLDGPAPLERLGRYLGWRAANLPGVQGASLAALGDMARHNVAEAGLRAEFRLDPRRPVRSVHVDGRLHRWEWLCLPGGGLLKADAVDHAEAHDLVGCQDVAWDIAGAVVEFDLGEAETETLRRAIEYHAGIAIDPASVQDYVVYYCGFQIGLWDRRVPQYAAKVVALSPAPVDGR